MPRHEDFGSGRSQEKGVSALSRYPGLEATIRGNLGLHESEEGFEAMVNAPLTFERVVEILSKDMNARDAARAILVGKEKKSGFDFDQELALDYSAKLAWAILESPAFRA